VSSDPVVDAVGLRCPLPVIRLAAAVRDLLDADAPGTRYVTVRSTDPAAGPDIAAWCRMRGHELIDQEWLLGPDQDAKTLRSRIQLLP
jgi:tRNA 2-thiouridine synthesizing protein A